MENCLFVLFYENKQVNLYKYPQIFYKYKKLWEAIEKIYDVKDRGLDVSYFEIGIYNVEFSKYTYTERFFTEKHERLSKDTLKFVLQEQMEYCGRTAYFNYKEI